MFHLYKESTGELISSTSLTIDSIPTGMNVVSSFKTGLWNSATLDFDPVPESTLVNKADFYLRVGVSKMLKIKTAAVSGDLMADTFLEFLQGIGNVDMARDDVIAGLNYLEVSGILTAPETEEIRNG